MPGQVDDGYFGRIIAESVDRQRYGTVSNIDVLTCPIQQPANIIGNVIKVFGIGDFRNENGWRRFSFFF